MNQHADQTLPKLRKKRQGIYLLPNLITIGSLFFGLLAIKLSIDGRFLGDKSLFIQASFAILAAAVCDALDGSVARLTHTQSSFGVQLDSLCDLVSFGVAPALLVYNFALHSIGELGFCIAFIYCACGTLRLARFNVQSSLGKASGNFTGIPIPMAATPVAICILAWTELEKWPEKEKLPWAKTFAQILTQPDTRNVILLVIMLLLAIGMISTFEYVSHKSLKLPRKRPFRFFAAIIILFTIFFTLQFTVSVAILSLIYCLHGPFLWLFKRRDKSQEEEEIFEAEEDEA